MKLTIDDIRLITTGAEHVEEEDGAFRFYRFTDSEMQANSNRNRYYPAGVALRFRTNAKKLFLSVWTEETSGYHSFFAFEILKDGERIGTIANMDPDDAKGNYAAKKCPLGDFSGEFELDGGEKTVEVLFPHSVYASLKEISLFGGDYIEPIPLRTELIAYGDSITQGYYSLFPSESYAYRIAKRLGMTLFNKGIDGSTYTPALVNAENGRGDGVVIVAYGTNDWRRLTAEEFRENASKFLDGISIKYPRSKVFVISPIYRDDKDRETLFGDFSTVATILSEICRGREGLHLIFGDGLVPHRKEMFGDLVLHPSGEGFAYYAENLYNAISEFL